MHNGSILTKTGVLKGKVKIVLSFMKHYAMKTCGGLEVKIRVLLISARNVGEQQAYTSAGSSPGKNSPVTIVPQKLTSCRRESIAFVGNLTLIPRSSNP